jgi:hypothetical protein
MALFRDRNAAGGSNAIVVPTGEAWESAARRRAARQGSGHCRISNKRGVFPSRAARRLRREGAASAPTAKEAIWLQCFDRSAKFLHRHKA